MVSKRFQNSQRSLTAIVVKHQVCKQHPHLEEDQCRHHLGHDCVSSVSSSFCLPCFCHCLLCRAGVCPLPWGADEMQGTLTQRDNKNKVENCSPIVSCLWLCMEWGEGNQSLFVLELLMGQICSLARSILLLYLGPSHSSVCCLQYWCYARNKPWSAKVWVQGMACVQ